jgi:hypothetical protein
MEDFAVRRRATYRQKTPKPTWRAIPDDAAEQLFSVLRCHRDRALISFWLSTGRRAAELLGLRHGDAALAPFPTGSADLLEPIRDGVITPAHVHAELGELVAGARAGRTSDDQITLYKSVGVAVEDAAAVAVVLRGAHERGVGPEVPLQGVSDGS